MVSVKFYRIPFGYTIKYTEVFNDQIDVYTGWFSIMIKKGSLSAFFAKMRNLSFFMVGKPLRNRGLVIIQGFCAVLEGGPGMREIYTYK